MYFMSKVSMYLQSLIGHLSRHEKNSFIDGEAASLLLGRNGRLVMSVSDVMAQGRKTYQRRRQC